MINFGGGDFIIGLAFIYCASDMAIDQNKYSGCYSNLSLWLIATFTLIFLFRASQLYCQHYHRCHAARIVSLITTLGLFPVMVVWTIVGNVWLAETTQYTPFCFEYSEDEWLFLFWLFICYTWIFSYILILSIALYLYRSEQKNRQYLLEMIREIGYDQISSEMMQHPAQIRERNETLDFVEEYGLIWMNKGLSQHEIFSLPTKTLLPSDIYKGNTRCTICLEELLVGDRVCELPCSHIFHKICAEIWLFREGVCPNCNEAVNVSREYLDAHEEEFSEPLLLENYYLLT